jgi:3-oxoacyl-[acyl-carrier-protein] synthase III
MSQKLRACIRLRRFGKLDDATLESLVVEVASKAIANAGMAPADVDQIVIGHFNQGLESDATHSPTEARP